MRGGDCIGFCGVFSPAELQKIRALGERKTLRRAGVNSGPASMRKCSVAWLSEPWLKARLWEVVQLINSTHYHFELEGLKEPLQYTVYKPGEFYGWHIDKGPTRDFRKLSLTVQLSAPDEYEGGDFEIMQGGNPETLPREQGGVLAFPSWTLHQVQPVTKGVRRALVVWSHGPEFR
jgi:PKHD-type hydroxylase